MKRMQLNITALLGSLIVAGLTTGDARAQATQYYPPSPRVHYAWRPATTTDAAVRPAVHTAAVLPPPNVTPVNVTPVNAFQPVNAYQPVTAYQPAPAFAPPTAPAGCCGNTYAPATYAPATDAVYPQATYVPTTPAVKAYRPLVHLAPPPPTYTVGQGLWGQSKVYIPDQHIRNTIRYLTP